MSVSTLAETDTSSSMAGNATSPKGFRAAGIHCGIKREKPDLALLVSEVPASAAGLFTTNKVKAAPVRYTERAIAGGHAQAIVVNSGNANACTGKRGLSDAAEMAKLAGEALGLETSLVLVASTGVIGVPLPMDAIRAGIPGAAKDLSPDGAAAASAILTTDSFPKTAATRVEIDGVEVTIGGMAKGAGMIHPNMATTLCFLTTDASVPPAVLRRALARAVAESFNSITVDGDTSTNDTVLLLANGRAGGPPITNGDSFNRFTAGLTRVAGELARMVVRDGEGATKLVEITVEGAASDLEARQAAMTVANSLLVKTALHGGEPNWGRILAALGRSGVEMNEETTDVSFGDLAIVRGGLGVPDVWDAAAAALEEKDISVRIRLGIGAGAAKVWTSDLSEEYVRINGSYTT
ncbi:MAG TPA: bifunctional glutamate N-acetyltransferase/amino-acid acetyltransferase ArgJ [Thermoanaerobaculia bacterium]|nr:bifunctional glutamate N-acetyltransferase/amino-acid acetyltransferase ArgJ [Thermoanaerobaculia bacterium]